MLKKESVFSRMQESPVLWFIPMFAVLLGFYFYPILEVIRLSFTTASLGSREYTYTFDSYVRVFRDPHIMNTFRITAIYVFYNVFFQLALGMLIAVAVNYGNKLKMFSALVARTVVLTAWIIPGVVVGLVWRIMLSGSAFGIVNYLLQSLGMNRVPFLFVPSYALASVIIANIWRGTAFSMILQYAGLQRIPDELYESAKMDGASVIRQFWHITIPMLKPILFINVVLITIYSFNTFDSILALTGGGPARATEVMTLSVFRRVFEFLNLGSGAALAVILLLTNIAMGLIYYKLIDLGEDVAA